MESPRTLIQAASLPAPDIDAPPRARIAGRGSPLRAGTHGGEDELILERYLPLERLGAGGFGEVWRAHDELLHREVALKRIWLGPDCDSERASREAHASARLSHPAIVRLYEAVPVDDAFYLISELVEGDTLAQLIAADELDDEEILEIALALARALAHAHSRGVIHRDVKPQNVLVPRPAEAPSGGEQTASAAKLADFGGASLTGEDALTRTGDVLGTLAYMAPEQTEGKVVDERADLYSLALVIYEALSGINPVRGANPAATARRIGRPIEPLQRRCRGLPRGLTRAIDRALSSSPRDRGTLAELCEAFAAALAEISGVARRPGAAVHADEQTARRPQRHEQDEREARARSPRRREARPAYAASGPTAPTLEQELEEQRDRERVPTRRLLSLPLSVWLAGALLVIGWQLAAGRAGVALLLLAALAPLPLLPRSRTRSGSSSIGAGWLCCLLAPLLGVVGLAGVFPALAGQASRWSERAAYGALGYWWLALAGALLDTPARVLWLAQPSSAPPRGVWESSLQSSAGHVIAPLLTLGVLCGALLWALAALVLPWIVRGRSAALDILAATVWAAALVALAPLADAGLSSQLAHPSPRGALISGVLAGLVAVAARALRGPI